MNGLIIGRTPVGTVLVEMTLSDYLESLPEIGGYGISPAIKRPEPLVPDVPPSLLLDKPRKPGRATKAQRRFNGKKEAAGLKDRVCPFCDGKYTPVRIDQTYCLDKACKAKKDKAYREAHKTTKAEKNPMPSVNQTLPAMTKEQRLAAIRETARRVAARHAGEGKTLRSLAPDKPEELSLAERQADNEG